MLRQVDARACKEGTPEGDQDMRTERKMRLLVGVFCENVLFDRLSLLIDKGNNILV